MTKKKFISVLCAALFSLGVSAQVWGDKAIAANFSYGFEVETIALGLKAQYNFTNQIRAEAAFNYWPENDEVSYWDVQANAHYLFKVSPRLKAYPLTGIGYMGYKSHYGISHTIVGVKSVSSSTGGDIFFNAGGGIQYHLTREFVVYAEAKYMCKDEGQLCLSAGWAFIF